MKVSTERPYPSNFSVSEVVDDIVGELSSEAESQSSQLPEYDNKPFLNLMAKLLEYAKTYDGFEDVPLKGINIETHFAEGKFLFFVKVLYANVDFIGLFLLNITDEFEIINLEYTGLTGALITFSYEVLETSQGTFIAAYYALNRGNGSLDLVPLDDLGSAKYSFDHVVDRHMGFYQIVGEEFGLLDGDTYRSAADRFANDKLDYFYQDVNDDGNTEFVFYGIRQIYLGDYEEPILWREYYVKQVYLYDPDIDDFVLSDELSEQILINEY
jgi:hypothetical protein